MLLLGLDCLHKHNIVSHEAACNYICLIKISPCYHYYSSQWSDTDLRSIALSLYCSFTRSCDGLYRLLIVDHTWAPPWKMPYCYGFKIDACASTWKTVKREQVYLSVYLTTLPSLQRELESSLRTVVVWHAWHIGSDGFYLMWGTPRVHIRWPLYVTRAGINSCNDLTFCIHAII